MKPRGDFSHKLVQDEILQATLPEELREESPTGFAITGHIGGHFCDHEGVPF